MPSIFPEKTPAVQSSPSARRQSGWVVYMLRCADGSLYTGVTTDLDRRLREHNFTANGARYTRTRRPVHLVHAENASDRSTACRREYQLKQLSRAEKEKMVASHNMVPPLTVKDLQLLDKSQTVL